MHNAAGQSNATEGVGHVGYNVYIAYMYTFLHNYKKGIQKGIHIDNACKR